MRRRAGESGQDLVTPNGDNHYTVNASDLPLHCPMPSMYLWNSHPKVFLPIEITGEAKCPYCSASYSLQAEQEASAS